MPPVRHLDAAAAQRLLAANHIILIDVREAGEYAREHIAGAQLMPLSQLDAAKLPRDKSVVVCCASGNRSQSAVRKLMQAGLTELANLEGGLMAWKAAGLPLAEDRRAPIPLIRQVQLAAGTLVLTGTTLGVTVSPWLLLIPGAVGAGLLFAGASGSCMMTQLLSKLPYNQPKSLPTAGRLA